MKIRQTGNEAVPRERTDRRTGMTKIVVTFRSFPNPRLLLTVKI
jgi:hypothetical protein